MRNLIFQFNRAGKHLKSIIQKIMSKVLKGASSSVKTVGDVVTTGLTIVGFAVMVLVILVMTLPSLLMMHVGAREYQKDVIPVGGTV